MTQQEEDLEALLAWRLYGSLRRAGKIIHASHETVRERSYRAATRLLESLPTAAPLRRVLSEAPEVDAMCQDLSAENAEMAANAV